MDHIVATIYFLDWAKNILELYTKSINKLFVVSLTEHCVRKRVTNATSVSDEWDHSGHVIETGRRLEAGVKVKDSNDEIKQLQRRLQLSKQVVENTSAEYVSTLEEKWISLAEVSAMYRLQTLVQMSGSLLIFMERIGAWIEKHRKVFSSYGRECSSVLDYAVQCFEVICVQAEIFGLEPVDKLKVRKDCSKFIVVKDSYKGKPARKRDQPLEFGKDIRSDVKRIEAQINYYRTSVHLVGNSLMDITQAILKAFPRDILEVTIKELRTIMERLPPGYHFPGKYQLTVSAQKLLFKSPPNKRQINEVKEVKQFFESMKTASKIESSSLAPKSIPSTCLDERKPKKFKSRRHRKSKSSKQTSDMHERDVLESDK